jgi:hypothetical protein
MATLMFYRNGNIVPVKVEDITLDELINCKDHDPVYKSLHFKCGQVENKQSLFLNICIVLFASNAVILLAMVSDLFS